MKSCLVLSDLDQRYKVGNFTSTNLKLIEANWKRIKASLELTIRLVNRFGIDRETLTSVNALLPIAYYLHRIGRGSRNGLSVQSLKRKTNSSAAARQPIEWRLWR